MSCEHCDGTVVYVIDESLMPVHKEGNKYQKQCGGCDRYLGMTSKAEFRRADETYFIPRDCDDRYDSEQLDNHFVCPSDECDADVRGEPDECPECGVSYDWE